MNLIRLILIFSVCLCARLSAAEIMILGVAQDAGYPQALCYKPHCLPGWQNKEKRLTATAIAVINLPGRSKLLFEATPHMPEQLYQLEQAAPSDLFKLDGVFLTHAHIGHYTGLMFFGHEAVGAHKTPVYAMPRMSAYLRENGPWSQLVKYKNIDLKPLQNETTVDIKGIQVTPVLVPHRDEFSETVGYFINGPSKTALFIPDINKWQLWDKNLIEQVKSVDYALIDATFYEDGEIPGRAMADIPHPFVVESMAMFADQPDSEKAKVHFIHMNHTNPLLNAASEQTKEVLKAGFNIARPGMRLAL